VTRQWLRGVVSRRPARVVGLIGSLALVVAFLATLGAFFGATRANLTRQAVADVAVDWQVELTGPAAGPNDAAAAAEVIAGAPGVEATRPVGYGDAAGLRAGIGGTEQTTGPAKVLGLPPDYRTTFPGVVRTLVGSDGVLLAQQTAANLHAAPGDRIVIERPGSVPATVTVDGVVDLPAADSLFQAVGSAPALTPSAPPDNVVLLPAGLWHQLYDPVAAARPDAVRTQYHVRLAHTLPADPLAAFAQVRAAGNNLEVRLAGAGAVGNNLAARLDAARADAVYVQLLFLFLGAPGVTLAVVLTLLIGASGRVRRSREQALLRMRGADRGRVLWLAGAEALVVGGLAAGVGVGAAALTGRAVGGTGFNPRWSVAAGVAGLVLAVAAVVGPAWRDARTRVVEATRPVALRRLQPSWTNLPLELVLLLGAWLLYRRTLDQGYHVVLAPEGVATVSVDYTTLLAPLLLWLGAAGLAWRVADLALGRGRRLIAAAVRPLAGSLSGVVAATMARQRAHLAQSLCLTAIAAAFAVSTALFNTTYAHQTRVDAQLTNGADVTASTPAGGSLPGDLPVRVRRLPGVIAAEPMQHRLAYVGNDLQDLYGVDPTAVGRATTIAGAYFAGGDATGPMARLAAQPDGVLVSAETVQDFQLQPGDLLKLRMQTGPDHTYREVAFHYIGVVREFPTAPTDSFLVANAAYVASATGSDASQTLLVRAGASPPEVAAAVRAALPPGSGVTVNDISTQLRATLSGLTAVDLTGLTRIELGFAVLLGVSATGLALWLGLAERRRGFAILAALGGRRRHLAAFVRAESVAVTAGGLLAGAALGWVLAQVLVSTLTGVFDPPPDALSVPWRYLGAFATAVVASVALAAACAVRAASHAVVETMRDE
jgi:putative ABC transport system permease protein